MQIETYKYSFRFANEISSSSFVKMTTTFYLFCLLGLVFFVWKIFKLRMQTNQVPLVEGHVPFIGHGFKFVGVETKMFYKVLLDLTEPGVSPRRFFLGPAECVIVDDPDQVKTVSNSKNCIDNSKLYEATCFTEALIMLKGSEWQTRRKIINPAFHQDVLTSFLPIFNAESKAVVTSIKDQVNDSEFDMLPSINKMTFDVMLSTTMGLEANLDDKNKNELLECYLM